MKAQYQNNTAKFHQQSGKRERKTEQRTMEDM